MDYFEYYPSRRNKMFKHIKVGDTVTRNFCGMKERWKVTSVSDTLITIGMGWTFDRETGREVDEDCPSVSGCSYLEE